MADVLIVCVREDEPQAKALAEMFEAAGFSIGGAPSNDAALRSSGAGVVVWSQASIRSRPFLDAAQRVINAEKAIVASLIDPPPPSSIGNSPAFDLSRWDGDPNDPSLDPLFFAVDRMVNSARVGAPAERQDTYEPPAPAPRAAPRAAPPPPPPAYRAPPPAPADGLGSEAEHWRSIRDSRNPADFMDYLSRYGPQGTFAEVAELRLKQLTASEPQRAPAPRPAPRPEPRAEAPRRDPPPVRRPEPTPQRRPDPPPQRRAEAAPPPLRRTPPPERTYDRNELRDPPKGEGGALRAFVLIALLGGAALAGGLYFGGGLGDLGAGAPQEQTQDISAPLGAPSDVPLEPGSADTLEAAPSQPIQTAAQTEQAARERELERERQQRERNAERARERAAETAANAAATPRSGPVSLAPPTNTAATATPGPNTSVPLQPPVSAPPSQTQPASTTARATPGAVSWDSRPTARRIADLYPQRALRDGIGGRVSLDCVVQPSLGVVCNIASESPAGEGFGRAAMSASSAYRARPTLSNGDSAVGARTRISVSFQAPQ